MAQKSIRLLFLAGLLAGLPVAFTGWRESSIFEMELGITYQNDIDMI